MSAFAKDDYKVTSHLTLNLGLRWEFYSSPYIRRWFDVDHHRRRIWCIRRDPDSTDHNGQFQQRSIRILATSRQLVSDRIRNNPFGAGLTTGDCRTGVQQNALLPVSTCDSNSLSSIQFIGPAVRIRA